MDQKTCYYCGTKYPLTEECCPLCEQTEIEPEELDETPVEITAEPEATEEYEQSYEARNKRANVVSTIVCIVLAIAVVSGALFILNTLGVLNFEKAPADDTSLSLPVEHDPQPTEILCTGVSLEPGNASFNTVGATVRLSVTVEPVNCTQAVAYLTSDESVASVSEDGVVTCVGNGTAEITVTCGDFAESMEVTCRLREEETDTQETPENTEQTDASEETAEELSLSTTDFTLFSAGETARITVNGTDAAAEWSSSDPSVATVEGGKVTAVSSGTATVSATVNGKTLKCTVRCKLPADAASPEIPSGEGNQPVSDEIFLTATDVTLVVGESFRLILEGEGFTSTDVAWMTTDGSVCTVDDVGNVTGVGTGMAEIIAEYQGTDYTCIIRCK